MIQEEAFQKVKIKIFRVGDELFVEDVWGNYSPVKLLSSLKRENLIVEPGKRAYLQARIEDDKIIVDILRTSDDGNIYHQTILGDNGVIEFDPWDRV